MRLFFTFLVGKQRLLNLLGTVGLRSLEARHTDADQPNPLTSHGWAILEDLDGCTADLVGDVRWLRESLGPRDRVEIGEADFELHGAAAQVVAAQAEGH